MTCYIKNNIAQSMPIGCFCHSGVERGKDRFWGHAL